MPARTSKGRDDLVMATNNSSIVSKRSVERIYFPDEPQYYRFFVKKYQRRAPLINRGYHLRMHLIDALVGRSSDPLPWRSMYRYPDACRGAKFVDIDFPDLLLGKRQIVEQTAELRAPLTNLEFPDDPRVLVTSDQYCQIACDLRQLAAIHEALVRVVNVPDCEFLFVAEVSITYMEAEAADTLIPDFCLLEQILPDGPSNPFAQTMLQHFNKLNTPLKCVYKFPTKAAQRQRFGDLGWRAARLWTLWEAWSDPVFFSPSERQQLDATEVFDEWEEFANFAKHYFVLHARNGAPLPDEYSKSGSAAGGVKTPFRNSGGGAGGGSLIKMDFSPLATFKSLSPRRFGAPLILKDVLGQPSVAHFFGAGAEGRLRSCDLYGRCPNQSAPPLAHLHQGGPAARMCFTLTDVGDLGYVLVGGRASPTASFGDTWIFKKDANRWKKTHDLPVPLFRHAVVRLGCTQLLLLAGGKSGPSAVFPDYLLYHPQRGWVSCAVDGLLRPTPLFGALLLSTEHKESSSSVFHGILAGGMTADGVVSKQAFNWRLDASDMETPTIRFDPEVSEWVAPLLSRFGAMCTLVDGWHVVAGGVMEDDDNDNDNDSDSDNYRLCERDVVRFRAYGEPDEAVDCSSFVACLGPDAPRPVLVGASMIDAGEGDVAVVGGGMTCFSMGTVWSEGVYTFNVRQARQPPTNQAKAAAWHHLKTLAVTNEQPSQGRSGGASASLSITPISRVKLETDDQFRSILRSGKPVVFAGLRLGDCLGKWTPTYLADKMEAGRKVVVHEAVDQAMDFVSKNFRYQTQDFKEFITNVDAGKMLYLRALSADKPSDAPARLDVDFPTVAGDFALPSQLAFANDRLFSSVLRVSGPVNMWLHYDVLANVYCQIHGSKRFYLFPPSDVTQLGFAPGASSSSIDVFSSLASASASASPSSSALSGCHPYEAVVGPGDVLFLPPLWLHTATPITRSSIAVNVFFRDLDGGYSTGRDVYGNRDLAAYEKARQDVAKVTNTFKNLPRGTREFYLRRVADELLQAALE
ncbi:leucine carboxyl methyltransferase [Niveomyces insectorum RCEF 264]|uniref:tRNA wybutosine-synthesizing protein 4 n=1 Tax=Niveomyces insectorum RCEF 264 TaxID=1081102 RepID=A0A167SJB5_9HYPO|nr:leucine carboxyl methyltransferase [Niveomyces insectorum RCEF 264]